MAETEGRWLARVTSKLGTVRLTEEWEWVPVSGPHPDDLALVAQGITLGYSYSPAHGRPGALLAREVADEVGGTVELPDVPEGEPGTVY